MDKTELRNELYETLLQINQLMAVMTIGSREYDELWHKQRTLRLQYDDLVSASLTDTSQVADVIHLLSELRRQSQQARDDLNNQIEQFESVAKVLNTVSKVSSVMAEVVR
ncbi:hypothetical protein [Vibrio proteolyticus]